MHVNRVRNKNIKRKKKNRRNSYFFLVQVKSRIKYSENAEEKHTQKKLKHKQIIHICILLPRKKQEKKQQNI